jgi:hypothetical protein
MAYNNTEGRGANSNDSKKAWSLLPILVSRPQRRQASSLLSPSNLVRITVFKKHRRKFKLCKGKGEERVGGGGGRGVAIPLTTISRCRTLGVLYGVNPLFFLIRIGTGIGGTFMRDFNPFTTFYCNQMDCGGYKEKGECVFLTLTFLSHPESNLFDDVGPSLFVKSNIYR